LDGIHVKSLLEIAKLAMDLVIIHTFQNVGCIQFNFPMTYGQILH